MSQVYVVGHASGTPSPAGFGVIVKQGTSVVIEHEQALDTATTLTATLTGVREALQDLPAGTVYAEIHLSHLTAYRLLTAEMSADRSRIQELLDEISTVRHHRQIETQFIHLLPGTHDDLDAAERLARNSASRAWSTIGSPACPACGDQMTSTRQPNGMYWICQTPHCGGRIRQYERRI